MRLARFFIDRPVFAGVLSILIVIVGGISFFRLPLTQYPEIASPTITVTAAYPGANAEMIAEAVAAPIEQALNGIEGLLYMYSQSTSSGGMQLTVTFELGTDLENAQVQVQNRVSVAAARLPEEVRRIGIVTSKSALDMLLVIHLLSPDESLDPLYITNYAQQEVRDVLARLDGVGEIDLFGERDYSMRVWLDPDRIASLGLTAGDIVNALRQQNIQMAGGALGQPPLDASRAFQIGIQLKGRLRSAAQFEDIIVNTTPEGRTTKLSDVARVELGAQDYSTKGYLDGKPAVILSISQRSGANALATAESIYDVIEDISKDFPEGLEYRIIQDPTQFIRASIDELLSTIIQAVALVTLVMLVFLQTWRASLIPLSAIPVSLIGTFTVMELLGFSINTLTLSGLVLAVGIVVDDAIVVVENVQRNIADGMSPLQAARATMDEVGSALIAMGLVLVSVFIPVAFLAGMSGEFYRQFAIAIAVATLISVLNSLTLSPVLSHLLQRPRNSKAGRGERLAVLANRNLDRLQFTYGRFVVWLVSRRWSVAGVYAAVIAVTAWGFFQVPRGFIPQQDQGYLITLVRLPAGASLERTERVVSKVEQIVLGTPGIAHTVTFVGLAAETLTVDSNVGAVFAITESIEERHTKGLTSDRMLRELRSSLGQVEEAFVGIFAPPAVRGIDSVGGFSMRVQDRRGRGLAVLKDAADQLAMKANSTAGLTSVFTPFSIDTPQLVIDVDRDRAEMLDVPVEEVFKTLEIYLGSIYINDFSLANRSYQVIAQADSLYRLDVEDIKRLRARSQSGAMVSLGSLIRFQEVAAPSRILRYNLYPAAEISGATLPGFGAGEGIEAMEQLAEEILPDGINYEWTGLTLQQLREGNTLVFTIILSVVFVFLTLAALYESWSTPIAVILILPICLSFSVAGIALRGLENDIFTQISFIVLVGLASKNAILIVEFARRLERQGKPVVEAVEEACRLRLRPILMTSFAFIFGVLPLVFASGAGAELRVSLGTAVFSGMLGVTIMGLIFTPVFYVIVRDLVLGSKSQNAGIA